MSKDPFEKRFQKNDDLELSDLETTSDSSSSSSSSPTNKPPRAKGRGLWNARRRLAVPRLNQSQRNIEYISLWARAMWNLCSQNRQDWWKKTRRTRKAQILPPLKLNSFSQTPFCGKIACWPVDCRKLVINSLGYPQVPWNWFQRQSQDRQLYSKYVMWRSKFRSGHSVHKMHPTNQPHYKMWSLNTRAIYNGTLIDNET